MSFRLLIHQSAIDKLARADGVQKDMTDRADRVLSTAQENAPVFRGEYLAGLHVETTETGGRRIGGATDHDIYVEADTGNLSKALDAAGGS